MIENYKCNRCGDVVEDVYYKIILIEYNVKDFKVLFDLDNFECLCRKCYNNEIYGKKDEYMFDENGDLIKIIK